MKDLEAIEAVAARAWALACEAVFPGEAEFLKERPDLTVEGSSFRVQFRLQQDRLGPDSELERTMVTLRFQKRRRSNKPWTVFVRGDWPERQDRFSRVGPLSAKQLRKAFSPRLRRKAKRTEVARDENIYVMWEMPRMDLTAQLVLFAIQTKLSSDESLMPFLQHYIQQTFRLRVRDRKDLALDVVLRLIQNKWWAEDARAWRKYIAKLVWAHRSRHVPPSGQLARAVPDISAIRQAAERALYDPQGSLLTVEEASRKVGLSPSTLYSRIQRRLVAVEFDPKGRRLIRVSDVEKMIGTPRLKDVIRTAATVRRCHYEAARKYVSRLRRQGHSLDAILIRLTERRS
jgi:Helix-turn-helix domain